MAERDTEDIEGSFVVYVTSHGVRGNLVVRKVVCIPCRQMAWHPYLHLWSVSNPRAIAWNEVVVLTASFMSLRNKSAIAIGTEGSSIAYP